MVSINIGAGQGVTQAIASKLGLSKDDLKKINLSTWQNVMTEVSNAQSQIDMHNASNNGDKQKSIFTGGRDVKTINQQSNWKSNFVVQQGAVEINDTSWNKIVQMLTGKSAGGTQEPPAPVENKPPSLSEGVAIPDAVKLPEAAKSPATESMIDSLGGKVIERSVNGEKQNIAVVEINGQKVRREINEDGTLGDTLATTKTFGKNKYISGDFPPETKVLEREVNGKKSQIGIYEDENGNKVRKLVVTDEQTGKTFLGENLVTVSTMGKNKYVTESKFNADVKTMLGLGENDEIPADLKAEYVTIGGESSIVIKKDGKVMDSSQLRAYMAEYKANDTNLAETFDNSFNTTGQTEIGDAAKLAKSQMNLINNNSGANGITQTKELINEEKLSQNPSYNIEPSKQQPAAQVLADIKSLKAGQSYTFTKANTSLEVIDGNLQNIEYSIGYIASKDANGNITVKNQNNGDISVYNSNGEPISSETDNGLFGDGWNFGKIRTHDDYLNNVQTLDLSEANFNYLGGIDQFLFEVSKRDGAAVYNSSGNLLFSCERGGYDEQDIFKGDNGQNLTKKQVEDLIRNNKLSKIEIKDAFDLSHVQEYHNLEYDINSPF